MNVVASDLCGRVPDSVTDNRAQYQNPAYGMVQRHNVKLAAGHLPQRAHHSACQNAARAQTGAMRQVGKRDQLEAASVVRKLFL